MVYICVEDFYEKSRSCHVMTRQEEIECAKQWKSGDAAARERLIESYTPMVAGYVRRAPTSMQTLGLVVYYMHALEKTADSFNFLQDSDPFSHRLSWALRQATVKYLVR